MSWLRLDDQFHRHRKVVVLSDRAWRLHLTGLLECCSQLTDGSVEKELVKHWPGIPKARTLNRCIDELVTAGLWRPTEVGWEIHDYLDFNPNRESVLAKRQAARERMKRARAKGVRANEKRTDGEPNANSRARDPQPVPKPHDPTGKQDPRPDRFEKSGGKDGRAGLIGCPVGLKLTNDQRSQLEMGGIPSWAIDELTTKLVAKWVASESQDPRPLASWRSTLSTSIISDYRNPATRPRKPAPEPEQQQLPPFYSEVDQ